MIQIYGNLEQDIIKLHIDKYKDEAKEVKEESIKLYGNYIPKKPLEDLIDTNNIHGWLQQKIKEVESRSSYIITKNYEIFKDESEEITHEFIQCVTENAENGDFASQEYLANLYWRGNENIKANNEKFVYWAEKAARQGDYLSAFHLGRYYETKRQYKNASNWYKTAAELNIIRRNKITARNSSGNYIK